MTSGAVQIPTARFRQVAEDLHLMLAIRNTPMWINWPKTLSVRWLVQKWGESEQEVRERAHDAFVLTAQQWHEYRDKRNQHLKCCIALVRERLRIDTFRELVGIIDFQLDGLEVDLAVDLQKIIALAEDEPEPEPEEDIEVGVGEGGEEE